MVEVTRAAGSIAWRRFVLGAAVEEPLLITHLSHFNYLPLALPFFSFLAGIFLVVAALIEVGVLRYAYMRLGVSSRVAALLLLGSLVGSYVNIPIAQLPE
jgi:uncharacterized membrane protein